MGFTLLTSNGYLSNLATNTGVRNMGTAISNAFANAGWVQASDIGQADWTTVVGNTAAVFGYEIWRMNDALANVTPIYVKYTLRASTAGRPGLEFQVGSGSDGAGTLTGPLTVAGEASTTTGSVDPWFFAGSANSILLGIWLQGSSSYGSLFSVERTRNANGADTDTGAIIIQKNAPQQVIAQYWNRNCGLLSRETSLNTFYPGFAGIPQGAGTKFNWQPIYFWNGAYTNPSLHIIDASAAVFGSNSFFYVNHYGTLHRYLHMSGMYNPNRGSFSSSYAATAILWE